MNHTPQTRRAVQFAARKHNGQLRITGPREMPLPYITHPFSVALLVAEDGASDDVVIAALLHDTIEDTGTTREEIVAAFNEHVAGLVEAVSERKEKDGRPLDWKERKTDYLARLEQASDDAVLIAIADKIDNIESKLEEYEKSGEAFLQQWKRPNADYLWFHSEALRIAQARLPEHPLTKRLAQVQAKQTAAFAR
ncbi:MAG: HD domain-containing protein [Minisyncoccota bacterium]